MFFKGATPSHSDALGSENVNRGNLYILNCPVAVTRKKKNVIEAISSVKCEGEGLNSYRSACLSSPK